mgnify:CR=1 FL=1
MKPIHAKGENIDEELFEKNWRTPDGGYYDSNDVRNSIWS